jgi:phage shock protein A
MQISQGAKVKKRIVDLVEKISPLTSKREKVEHEENDEINVESVWKAIKDIILL